jgi:hypothetical protein
VLINAAVPRNLARYTQYVAMLAEVEADVIESFRHGGVPDAKYPRFQALMAESSTLRFDALLIDKMVPLTGMAEALARTSGRRAIYKTISRIRSRRFCTVFRRCTA